MKSYQSLKGSQYDLVAENTKNLPQVDSQDYLPYLNQSEDKAKANTRKTSQGNVCYNDIENRSLVCQPGVKHYIGNSLHQINNTNIAYCDYQNHSDNHFETIYERDREIGEVASRPDLLSFSKTNQNNDGLLNEYLMCARDPAGYQAHLLTYNDIRFCLPSKKSKSKGRKMAHKSVAYK